LGDFCKKYFSREPATSACDFADDVTYVEEQARYTNSCDATGMFLN